MDIVVTREFRKNFKHLSGKYASLRDDLRLLQSQLMENPFMGVELSGGFRKIRLAIRSKGKGKSGGASLCRHQQGIRWDYGRDGGCRNAGRCG